MASSSKPKPIKPVGKQARNTGNRAAGAIPPPSPPPLPTDLLFEKLIEAGNAALASKAYEQAEEFFIHARLVGATLKKTRKEMMPARKGFLEALNAILSEK